MKIGAKRFRVDSFPCKRGHVERYTESLACAECAYKRHAKQENPIIGQEIDDDINAERLIKTNIEFLKRLHVEKLEAIRAGVAPR